MFGLSQRLLVGALACAACAPAESRKTEPGSVAQDPPVDAAGEGVAQPEIVEKVEPASPPVPAWQPRPSDLVTPHRALEFPEGLDRFYEGLAAVDDGERRVVRIVNLGASMIGADGLPGVLREKFQSRFGDGGAGLVLMQRYMPNYMHRTVVLDGAGWEHCYIAYLCKSDGFYGLGGTTFWSRGGARTKLSTRKEGLGDEVAHFDLWYAAQPGGGRLGVRVDGGERVVIETRADQLEDRYHAVDVPQGAHAIEVEALGHGSARAYGVVLETTGPGVTWEQFSMLGVFTRKMLSWNDAHIAGQVARRDPDLIVFAYGGNDVRRVSARKLDKEGYVLEYEKVVQKVRAGKPGVSCLILAITDRAKSLDITLEPEHLDLIVEGQREVARRTGCAFYDTYSAMGGGGSLLEWRRRNPPLASPDLKHLNHRGWELVGGWIFDAVVAGYVDYRRSLAGR